MIDSPSTANWNVSARFALAVALLLEACVLVRGQTDLIASDPLWYAVIAHDIAHGAQVFTATELHPFVMRIGLTVPLAGLYRILGVSTLVTNLPAILSGLACLVLLYVKWASRRQRLIALGLGVTCVGLMHQSILLNVDLPCAVLLGFTVYFISLRNETRWWLVAAVGVAFAAFLIKESAIWCVPIWMWALVVDAREEGSRGTLRKYLPALVFGLSLTVCYLCLCERLWGSPLARFHGIEEIAGEHAWSLTGRGMTAWVDRMTWQVPHLLLRMFGIAIIPAGYGAWVMRGRDRIWVVAAGAFILLYWFGSVSFRHYAPLPISERMAANCLPPVLILATRGLDEAISNLSAKRWLIVPLVVVGVALVVPAARLSVTNLRRSTPETHAFEALRLAMHGTEPALLLSVDPRGPAIAGFYFGFHPPTHLAMGLTSDASLMVQHPGTHVFILVNTLRGNDTTLLDQVEQLHLPFIYKSRFVSLYEAGDGSLLRRAQPLVKPAS